MKSFLTKFENSNLILFIQLGIHLFVGCVVFFYPETIDVVRIKLLGVLFLLDSFSFIAKIREKSVLK